MRIATKLTLLLLLAVAVVMAAFGYIRVRQERQRLIDEFQQEVLLLANSIKLTVEHALRDRRPQDIQELLTEMVREPNPVDRIRIFDRTLEDINSAMTDVAATTLVPQAELEQVLKSGKTIVRYPEPPRCLRDPRSEKPSWGHHRCAGGRSRGHPGTATAPGCHAGAGAAVEPVEPHHRPGHLADRPDQHSPARRATGADRAGYW